MTAGPTRRHRSLYSLRALTLSAPIIALGALWLPLVWHHRIPTPTLVDNQVDQARVMPTDSQLAELDRYSFGLELRPSNDAELMQAAEAMLRGEATFPGVPEVRLTSPYSSADSSSLGAELFLAALTVPNTFLRAYDVTGEDRFLTAARDAILAFADFEKDRWIPRGLLRNDHATSARVLVLTRFWRRYRGGSGYDPEVGRVILEQAARTGALLSKPSHFTYGTNHGVMQNLALWHLAVGFPTLPDRTRWVELAFTRLGQQFRYLIDDQGVILEHSSGYQKWGLDLLDLTFRYLEALNIDAPAEWSAKYAGARTFYEKLQRPDGTLPVFGDTRGSPYPSLDPKTTSRGGEPGAHRSPSSLYPTAGYLIWWDESGETPGSESAAQTAMTWSYFPGHGHKHADELSVTLWADGQTWWTNVGYWPYGTPGRPLAESWTGSNAPHRSGEGQGNPRRSRALSVAGSPGAQAADMLRETGDGLRIRRQIVHPSADLWIVVDFARDSLGQGIRTVWTTWPDVTLHGDSLRHSYVLASETRSSRLEFSIVGSPDMEVSAHTGSMSPFAGWVVIGYEVTPTLSIVVDEPGPQTWTAYVWLHSPGTASRAPPQLQDARFSWQDEEHWQMSFARGGATCTVSRVGARLVVAETCGPTESEIALGMIADTSARQLEIEHAFERAVASYPRFPTDVSFRSRLTYLFVLSFVVQEIVLLATRVWSQPRYAMLNVGFVMCWIIGGYLTYIRYF